MVLLVRLRNFHGANFCLPQLQFLGFCWWWFVGGGGGRLLRRFYEIVWVTEVSAVYDELGLLHVSSRIRVFRVCERCVLWELSNWQTQQFWRFKGGSRLQFVQGLGFPGDAGFYDVYGFDDDLLAMVPTPVLAVLLLFPISPEVRFYPLAFARVFLWQLLVLCFLLAGNWAH